MKLGTKLWMIIFLSSFLFACKKDGCGNGYNDYVFWMGFNHGELTVEVKDENGEIQTSDIDSEDSNLISVFYGNHTGHLPSCDEFYEELGNAYFVLRNGKKYTFRAYNNNVSFTGTIDSSCEEDGCNAIRVDSTVPTN